MIDILGDLLKAEWSEDKVAFILSEQQEGPSFVTSRGENILGKAKGLKQE